MAKAYKTNYTDPGGNSKVGYIIEGKTYKDPEGTQRIEVGSTVETADGFYTLTSSGGKKKSDFFSIDSTASKINDMKKESRNMLESLFRQKSAVLENQKRKIQNDYDREARAEYIRSMEAQKNINQLLKAQGINGGMSESTLLKNTLAHENAVNDLKLYRDDLLSDIDMKLLELRNETDYNIASENSKYDQMYLEAHNEMAEREWQAFLNDLNIANENYFQNRSYERGVFESDRQFEADEEARKESMDWEREKEENVNNRFYENLNWDKEAFNRDFNYRAENDAKNYALSLKKATSSGGSSKNSDYERKKEAAKIMYDLGNIEGYGELFGWDKEMTEEMQELLNSMRK